MAVISGCGEAASIKTFFLPSIASMKIVLELLAVDNSREMPASLIVIACIPFCLASRIIGMLCRKLLEVMFTDFVTDWPCPKTVSFVTTSFA